MKHGAFAFVILLSAVALTAVAGAARPASGSNIELVMLASARSADSTPTYSSEVTFSVSTSVTSQPWVDLACYQLGILVYEQWHGFYDTYQFGQTFKLGPTQRWTGGAASCTARLVSFGSNGRDRTLATTSFDVSG